ncbi:MAG: 5'-3' exonuclease H3TH domain-containing protein [Halioglobus sp.]
MNRRACLLDSSIYIFRAWFSMPDNWHSPDGHSLNAVYGYTRFLLEFLQRYRPGYFLAGFDESLGSCFRNDIYPGYKSSRELPDEALAFQLSACREITARLGIPCYGSDRYEADDYLASLAKLYRASGVPVSVITRDKDLGQIVQGPDDLWWDYASDVTLDEAGFRDKFGVSPGQFADYLALVGDKIDDIPGVPGVGAKTATRLLQEYGDLPTLHENLHAVGTLKLRGAARIAQNLQSHWPQVEIARRLTVLEEDIPGLMVEPAFDLTQTALDSLAEYLSELNLEGPLTRRCHSLLEGHSIWAT